MTAAPPVILPGATIGILGGGQLGRMIAMAARGLGYRVQVMDPDPSCPARFVVDACFEGNWNDARAAADLARGSDVVTLEIEQVPIACLEKPLPSMRPFAPAQPRSASFRTASCKKTGCAITASRLANTGPSNPKPTLYAPLPNLAQNSKLKARGVVQSTARSSSALETPPLRRSLASSSEKPCIGEKAIDI